MRLARVESVIVAGYVLGCALPAAAQQGPPPSRTETVVAGDGYDAGGLHRLIFGSAYRDLWGTEIKVEVLDLEHEAGGLTAVMIVGRLQTAGLALRGADGRSYTFRGVLKDLARTLPEELRETALAGIAQDQLVASLPGGEVAAVPLTNAVGVLQPAPKLVVMPDDPRLGEFRERFAGVLGTLSEFPTAAPQGGTYGATKIYGGLETIALLDASSRVRVDTRAFLRARLTDLLLGDWDRHIGQWRFARIPGHEALQPIAEDRDQAFSRYEGIAMTFTRDREPKFDHFGPRYQGLEGLTWNARSVDRRLLGGLDRAAWLQVAREIQQALPDEVIRAAIERLPAAYYERVGAGLIDALTARRNGLVQEAGRYYEYLSAQLDVHGTDAADLVRIDRAPDGAVQLSIAPLATAPGGATRAPCDADVSGGQQYLSRRLLPDEVHSLRLYIGAGDDRVLVTGPATGGIEVRIVGGGGNNVLCDSVNGRTVVFDDAAPPAGGAGWKVEHGLILPPAQTLAAAGTPEQTQGSALNAKRDWGGTSYGLPVIGFGPDIGLVGGLGRVWERYAFRKRPYASQHQVRFSFALGVDLPRIDYSGFLHHENRRSFWILRALASGIETLRFYGLGNETSSAAGQRFFRVRQAVLSAETRIAFKLDDHLTVSTGPVVRYSSTDTDDPDRFVTRSRSYGVERLGQVGWAAGLDFNNRTFPGLRQFKGSDEPLRWGPPELGRGYTVQINAHQYPRVWDLRDAYGWVDARAAGTYWLGSQGPGFGFRLGAKTTWGEVPYYDAAFLGSEQLRGLRPNRFAGDSAAYANGSVLVRVGRMNLLVPGHWGIVALGGVGRVWVEGEESDTWHTSFGGGVWWAPWNLQNALRVFVARSDETTLFYGLMGLDF